MKRRKIGNIIISIMLTGILVLQTVVSANAADLFCDDIISDDLITMEDVQLDDEILASDVDFKIEDLNSFDDEVLSQNDDGFYNSDVICATNNIETSILGEIEINSFLSGSEHVLTFPLPGFTRANIGNPFSSEHNGIDINGNFVEGTKIVAAMSGVVKRKYECSHTLPNDKEKYPCCDGYGTGLNILGDDGRYYGYAHMMFNTIPEDIKEGTRIEQGQMIGRVGKTGKATGFHLHFQITTGNQYGNNGGAIVNPMNEKYDIDFEDIYDDDEDDDDEDDEDEMEKGTDLISDNESVLVSALSIDKNTMKITKNAPYVVGIVNGDDIQVVRGLSNASNVWEIGREEKRFYSIRKEDDTNKCISLEEEKKKRVNIYVCKWYDDDSTSYWSFDERLDGQFLIENRYSGMCVTKYGNNICQKSFYKMNSSNVNDQLWLLVSPVKPIITTTKLPNGKVGSDYNVALLGECDKWIEIEWSLASDSAALPEGLTISKDGVISGTPDKAGKYNVKVAATNEFGTTTANYTITITGDAVIPVTDVRLNNARMELQAGAVTSLTATVLPANATNRKITWSSDNAAVATVDENGKITAVSEGTAKITASSADGSNKSATCVVTVKPIPIPDGITIKADEVTGVAGKPISVPVRILGNTGLGSMALTITSDPALTLTGIERGDILKKGTFETDVKTGLVQWWTTSNSNAEGDGILFILKYDIKSDAKIGKYPISVSCTGGIKENITDKESVTLDVTINDGSLIIANIVIIPGDVTGNGMVAMDDVVKVARAASGNVKLTDAEKLAGDVTGDGVVAMGDVVKIARFVAKSIDKL